MTPSFNYTLTSTKMTLRRDITYSFFRLIFLTVLSLPAFPGWAATSNKIVRDSVETYFRLNNAVLDTALFHNGQRLDTCFSALAENPAFDITGVDVVGSASPEGGESLNHRLSDARARNLLEYISHIITLPDSLVSIKAAGRDWINMRRLVEADKAYPQRMEVMDIIDSYGGHLTDDPGNEDECMRRIMQLDGGDAYSYLRENIFPLLRKAILVVEYDRPSIVRFPVQDAGANLLEVNLQPSPNVVPIILPSENLRRPLYMALKTNMLYDLAAVPNMGLELYLGRGWSMSADGMYAWWSNDNRHRYWRIYGGALTARRWFGRVASRKPLTGHHIGVYAGAVTFDFEWGKRGYMGGIPRGTLLDRCMLVGGVEYGYSLPVTRRFNIDFTLGVGYLGGKYIKYDPRNGHYFEDSVVKLNYFGPTKAEVSLVWLFGHDNHN